MTGSNDRHPTRLEQVLHALRIRISSDSGVVPRTFEVQGLAMSEAEFRSLCWCLGVSPDDVVRAVRKRR